MPTPSDYLPAKQKNGIPLGADEIYKETWGWLKQKNFEDNIAFYLQNQPSAPSWLGWFRAYRVIFQHRP